MAPSKIVFIVNPRAGHGSTGSDWPIIETLARDRLGSFETYMTRGPGDAVDFARAAVEKSAGLVVCVGGDGTLNEVVNGVMAHDESIRSDVVLGFVPDGTGCDFVKTVPIPGLHTATVAFTKKNNIPPGWGGLSLGILLVSALRKLNEERFDLWRQITPEIRGNL